ncbi:MAG: hypothetical protein R6X32_00445 [Chloroflexota bacterium]
MPQQSADVLISIRTERFKSASTKLLPVTLTGLLTLLAVCVTLEWGLRYFHQLIPLPVCASDDILGTYICQPYFEYDKPIRLGYRYQPNLHFEGWWDPADPNLVGAGSETRPSERSDAFWLIFQTDEMGFPNSEPVWRDQYDIIVTGDSFVTRFSPQTWIELLAEQSGHSILTLGASSWGPLSQVEAVKLYGLDKRPEWVIMLYFEGNDLLNVAQYIEREHSGLDWREYDLQGVAWYRQLVTVHLARWLLQPAAEPVEGEYTYPLIVNTEVGLVETVFKDSHLLPLSADYETLARSNEFERTAAAILELRDLTEAQNGRFLLVYVPAKEHITWSRIWDPVDVNNVLARTRTVTLSEGDHGRLQWGVDYIDYDTFTANIGAQGRLFDDFTRENGVEFLNLAPALFEKTLQEGEVYHYADPHWNQAGSQLVADLIAVYLVESKK